MAKYIDSYTRTDSFLSESGTAPRGETPPSSSTWNISVYDTNGDITVSGSTFTINYPAVYVTRTNTTASSAFTQTGAANFTSVLKNPAGTTLWTVHQRTPLAEGTTWTSVLGSGKQAQVYRNYDVTDPSKVLNTSSYFNSSNPTVRTVNFTWTTSLVPAAKNAYTTKGLYSRFRYDNYTAIYGVTLQYTDQWTTSVTLNAPPTFDSTNVSFNESYHVAGHTTATVTISNLSAKYYGTIEYATLKIGNQTVSRTTNGTLSIACNAVGTFTPTVTVKDSRNQITTKSLAAITINSHTAPVVTSSQVSFDAPAYANYCNATVTVSGATAYQGASVSSIKLTIGSQTATRANNGTLTIACNAVGTFTPTVTITDNWGGSKTISLNNITVNQYVSPTVVVDAERTDSTGVVNDEGTSAVVSAKLTYTYQTASLQVPTVVVTNNEGTAVTGLSVTWYSDRALTTAISAWSTVTSGSTVYALITDNDGSADTPFNTQYSYQIKVTPHDTRTDGNPITTTLGSAFYTVDFYAGGHGIAFGQACTADGFYCNMDAHFKDKAGIMRAMFDFFYPVGSYYETSLPSSINGHSYESGNLTSSDIALCGSTWFDPRIAWGGTWSKLGEGVVLMSGGGSSYAVGTTYGGNTKSYTPAGSVGVTVATHKLTVAEMPAHDHGSKTLTGTFDLRRWTASGSEVVNNSGIVSQSSVSTTAHANASAGTNDKTVQRITITATHTHTSNGSGTAHGHPNSTGSFTGSPATINVMQASLATYIWHRTA